MGWAGVLAAIAMSGAMVAAKVVVHRRIFVMPGGVAEVASTGALLAAWAVVAVLWRRTLNAPFLRAATRLGFIGAGLQIAHLVEETFLEFGAPWSAIIGVGLLLATFLLWGVAGYRTARDTGRRPSPVLAGAWCALVTMSMAVLFGFALEFYLFTPKPEYVATWAEFKRSGWIDIEAFTIANTLDSARSHLIFGPIIGAIAGVIAGAIASARAPKAPVRHPGAA